MAIFDKLGIEIILRKDSCYMKNISFSPPDITQAEIDEVVDTLKSGWITTGPKTRLFEDQLANYCGTNKAVCYNSATACMENALRLFGIGPDDEVITSAYTYTASASVIYHVGAKIVLVDIQEDSYEMDYQKLQAAITSKTKAIIPVDLAGIVCDYDAIYHAIESSNVKFQANSIMQKKLGRILVLADAAHSFGALRDNKKTGSIADFTSFSFHAVKNLTTGEGGALTWRNDLGFDDDDIYKYLRLLSLNGQNKDAISKVGEGGWQYDIIEPLYKCNMTDIAAALGIAQLKRYDQLLLRRKYMIARYNECLSKYQVSILQHQTPNMQSSGHLYMIRLLGKNIEQRNEFINSMAAKGIRCNVHYKPLPLLTAYKNLGFLIDDYPNAQKMYSNEVTLPLHTCLSDEDIEYVCAMLGEVLA